MILEEQPYRFERNDGEVTIGTEMSINQQPKQETLEEAAIDFINMFNGSPTEVELFIAGAKWQAERMYSEEDLKKAFRAGEDSKEDEINGDGETPFKQWFEQFKKK